jgi:hypothetical protein
MYDTLNDRAKDLQDELKKMSMSKARRMVTLGQSNPVFGVPNIPPEIGLVAALGSYLVPRFRASEKASSLFERAGMWIKSKLGK